jgi:hypothetical protein
MNSSGKISLWRLESGIYVYSIKSCGNLGGGSGGGGEEITTIEYRI